jgi:hypothetical protein
MLGLVIGLVVLVAVLLIGLGYFARRPGHGASTAPPAKEWQETPPPPPSGPPPPGALR